MRIYSAVAALAIATALFAFFRCTATGTAIRACADNLTGAAVVGLDVKRLYAITFGIGLACVGAAGALMVTIADAAPSLGPAYTLLAFIIVIVGGLGSMAGALVGGLLIGVSEALAGFLIDAVDEEHVLVRAADRRAGAAAARPDGAARMSELWRGLGSRERGLLVGLLVALVARAARRRPLSSCRCSR